MHIAKATTSVIAFDAERINEQSLINTPLQRGVGDSEKDLNRFSGFQHSGKPLKRFARI